MSRKTIDTTLRNSFLERIKKPGCPSVKTIAEEMGLPKATLYSWIAAERQRNRQGISMNRKTAKRSALNKFNLVAKSEGMGIDELEKFCAENGVSFTELQSWRDLSLSAMENSDDGNVMSVKQHEDEVAKLKAELARKEKALAEAAALLILQKKLRRYWDRKSSGIQEKRNPCSHRGCCPKWRKAFQGLRGDWALRTSLQTMAQAHRG